MNLNVPKHPDARYFATLFKRDSYRSFRLDVEAVIAGLATPFERGKAFEVWAEGFLVAVEGLDPKGLWRPEDDLLPPLERQRLGLPRADIGIDSVYLSETNGAYQFKFRIGRTNLTRDDLATFLALAYQCQFPNKIVVTNSERIDSLTHYAVTLIRGSRLDELSSEQLGQIADYLSARPVKKDNLLQPRQDQFEAVCEINQVLRQGSRAQQYGFCGTGKTLIQLWLMESRAPRTTLVLVPSLWLLSQIRNDWLAQRRSPFIYRCVCSDEKIKREDGEITIDDCNFPVFTQPEDLTAFLNLPSDQPKVVFSTYQSSDFIVEGARDHTFDLGLFDEAHLTAGHEGRLFSRARDDANIRIAKRVFFTATPVHHDPRRTDAEGEAHTIYSMANEATYGPVAYDLPARRAIELDIICDYKVLYTVFTTTEVNDWLRRHGQVLVKPDLDGPDWVKASTVANQLALVKVCEDHPEIKKIFSYHSSVSAASSFVAPGPEGLTTHLKDFYTGTINSVEMDTDQRRDTFRLFEESPKALISNYRCLIHGVNAPSVNLVMFASPKRSRIDCVQAAGRALRKAPGKSCGYILLCTYVATPENESIEEAARRTKFDTLLDVLQALKDWDEKFVDILRELAQPKARAKGYADWVLRDRVQLIGPPVLLEALEKSIRVHVIDTLIPGWDKMYAELVAYKEANGHCNVPASTGPLGVWCNNIRGRRKAGKSSPEQIAQLDAIGFDWNPIMTAWAKNYAELVAYKEIHGNCNVATDSSPLGVWCAGQRQNRREGKLSPERIAQLETLDFCWDPIAALWDKTYAELVAYKKVHGHCNVPASTGPLGVWCTTLRGRKAKLSPEQIAKLDALGFCWDPIATAWDKNYTELVA